MSWQLQWGRVRGAGTHTISSMHQLQKHIVQHTVCHIRRAQQLSAGRLDRLDLSLELLVCPSALGTEPLMRQADVVSVVVCIVGQLGGEVVRRVAGQLSGHQSVDFIFDAVLPRPKS